MEWRLDPVMILLALKEPYVHILCKEVSGLLVWEIHPHVLQIFIKIHLMHKTLQCSAGVTVF